LVYNLYFAEGGLGWPTLFGIIDGVAQGMHCLHEHGIVHMDMKPSNILLDSGMNPKIADFGISEVLNDGNDQMTRDSTRVTLSRNRLSGGNERIYSDHILRGTM
jgi:L1 cell adhesion molecule like protein